MKNYQIVLPLLALAFAMTFVEKTTALGLWLSSPCPENSCGVLVCSDTLNLPKIRCLEITDGGCTCEPSYYLQDNTCFPAEDCRVTCPKNMEFQACSRKPPTCGSLWPSIIHLNEICRPRCVCKSGYILDQEGSENCIPVEEC
ncbi:hemocytin-like [Mantella aurantiaca]